MVCDEGDEGDEGDGAVWDAWVDHAVEAGAGPEAQDDPGDGAVRVAESGLADRASLESLVSWEFWGSRASQSCRSHLRAAVIPISASPSPACQVVEHPIL